MIDIEKLEADRKAAWENADLRGFYQEHWDELIAELKQLRTVAMQAQEAYIIARGFMLRDDRPIREGDPHFEGIEEAYSLFQVKPMERHHVFAGRREWAVEEAYKYVKGLA